MTDKEMLEFAAKAAGIEIDKSPFNGGGFGNDGFDISGNVVIDWHNGEKWNPLTDDGDALRLAVALNMDICICHQDFMHDREFVTATYTEDTGRERMTREDQGDPYAATRRAITRAAAAIGEAMP